MGKHYSLDYLQLIRMISTMLSFIIMKNKVSRKYVWMSCFTFTFVLGLQKVFFCTRITYCHVNFYSLYNNCCFRCSLPFIISYSFSQILHTWGCTSANILITVVNNAILILTACSFASDSNMQHQSMLTIIFHMITKFQSNEHKKIIINKSQLLVPLKWFS